MDDGAVEFSANHPFVSDEPFEVGFVGNGRGVGAGFVFDEDDFEELALLLAEVGAADGLCFEGVGASESPIGGGDAFDEEPFGSDLGVEVFHQVVEELVEVFGVFAEVALVHEDVSGDEAVGGGVGGDAGFSLFGAWSGGFLGGLFVGLSFSVGVLFGFGQWVLRCGGFR